MKPFKSEAEMLAVHKAMFGVAGRFAAELVLKWAPKLFAEPLDPLTIRVVLAPVEIGPYNGHAGYYHGEGDDAFILGNRHHCRLVNGELVIINRQHFEDFVVHEMTHMRQVQLMNRNGWRRIQSRGAHRDRGWYSAIVEACPTYLGVELPASSIPAGPRTRKGAIDEKILTHWPHALRELVEQGDPRLPPVTRS